MRIIKRALVGLLMTCNAGVSVAETVSPAANLPPPTVLSSRRGEGTALRSIREFGVAPERSPSDNARSLQRAIDWASPRGAALFVDPSDEPYRIDSGIILRANASLIGVHGPVGRGTVASPGKKRPVGSVFAITDITKPFLAVESATQVRGIQFWYPSQTLDDPAAIIKYPPTIQLNRGMNVEGVTLSSLTFYGEYIAMDFNAIAPNACEQILFEHCYGYPLGGEFIRIDHCYDIPRILHCHVNPANLRKFRGGYSRAVIDHVVKQKTFTYSIDHTDNAQLIDLFTFGAYGGIRLGAASYGQLTNFNLDCVSVGIHKSGDNTFNRNWQIAQGSIIANTGERLEDVHPIIIDGVGHTAITNVEAFSGPNPVLTNFAKSQSFLNVRGDQKLTISMFGCRMRNYASDSPFLIQNREAVIRAVACFDKHERLFEYGAAN